MDENLYLLLNYIPIRRDLIENEYIEHLVQTTNHLINSENNISSFGLMSFHLLFMLSIQFKALRIIRSFPQASKLFLSAVGGRYKEQLLSENLSVFDLALINERTLLEIFQLLNPRNEQVIISIKKLIDRRNDEFAHANGVIILDCDTYSSEYIDALERLQNDFIILNNDLVNEWDKEVKNYADTKEFVELMVTNSLLTKEDFISSNLSKYNIFD